MEKITCYKCSDGRIFEHESQASYHESQIELLRDISILVTKVEPSYPDDIITFIFENYIPIKQILQKY